MRKDILTVFALILLCIGALWIWGSQDNSSHDQEPTPEPGSGEIADLLRDLKEDTDIDFSEVRNVTFDWNTLRENDIEGAPIEGNGFEASGILSDQYGGIESFFKENGFEADMHNIAAGIVGSRTGFVKGRVFCTISEVNQLDEEGMPLKEGKIDVGVNCGKSVEPIGGE